MPLSLPSTSVPPLPLTTRVGKKLPIFYRLPESGMWEGAPCLGTVFCACPAI